MRNSEPEVTLSHGGRVKGLSDEGLSIFKGIRYGESPAGGQRFRLAEAASWHGLADATAFGPASIQTNGDAGPRIMQMLGMKEFTDSESEDCLFVNVWAPEDAGTLPVLVWLHSASTRASGSLPLYDGAALARKQRVIVVTLNHRLGVLGHLDLEELLGEQYRGSGNASYDDIVLALKWVHDNITSFGGDVNNVTIAGGCAGGAKVTAVMAMPKARGLFQRALVQSRVGSHGISPEEGHLETLRLLEAAAPPLSRNDLRQSLVNWDNDNMRSTFLKSGYRISSTVDELMPQNSLAAIVSGDSRIPLMIGTARDDASFMATSGFNWRDASESELAMLLEQHIGNKATEVLEAYREVQPTTGNKDAFIEIVTARHFDVLAKEIALAHSDGSGQPAYLYRFDWRVPLIDSVPRAAHGMDVAFSFDNIAESAFASRVAGSDTVAKLQSTSLANFMRTGDPSIAGMPKWEPISQDRYARMLLSDRWTNEPAPPAWHDVLTAAVGADA